MTARRITALVAALRANRQSRSFAAHTKDVEATRSTIALRAHTRGDGLRRPEFVAELRRRLAKELEA